MMKRMNGSVKHIPDAASVWVAINRFM